MYIAPSLDDIIKAVDADYILQPFEHKINIDLKTGKIVDDKSLWWKHLIKDLDYYVLHEKNEVFSNMEYKFTSIKIPKPIDLEMEYKVSCINDKSEDIVKAFYKNRNPKETLDHLITEWTGFFFKSNDLSILHFEQLQKKLEDQLKKNAKKIGLWLELSVKLKRKESNYYLPLEKDIEISVKHYSKTIPLKFKVDLVFLEDNHIYRFLYPYSDNDLKKIIQRVLERFFIQQTLDNIYDNRASFNPEIKNELNQVFNTKGREVFALHLYPKFEIEKEVQLIKSARKLKTRNKSITLDIFVNGEISSFDGLEVLLSEGKQAFENNITKTITNIISKDTRELKHADICNKLSQWKEKWKKDIRKILIKKFNFIDPYCTLNFPFEHIQEVVALLKKEFIRFEMQIIPLDYKQVKLPFQVSYRIRGVQTDGHDYFESIGIQKDNIQEGINEINKKINSYLTKHLQRKTRVELTEYTEQLEKEVKELIEKRMGKEFGLIIENVDLLPLSSQAEELSVYVYEESLKYIQSEETKTRKKLIDSKMAKILALDQQELTLVHEEDNEMAQTVNDYKNKEIQKSITDQEQLGIKHYENNNSEYKSLQSKINKIDEIETVPLIAPPEED